MIPGSILNKFNIHQSIHSLYILIFHNYYCDLLNERVAVE